MNTFTAQIPKALIPVLGKPFIDYQLAHLVETGVTDIILSIGYRGNQIRDHVQDGMKWGVPVRYVDEGEDLRGTAGALRLALDQGVLDPGFLMTWGDAFLPIDFSGVWRYFETRSEPILMTVFKNNHRWGSSNVIFNGEKVTLYDKAAGQRNEPRFEYLDYGVSGLRRSMVESDIGPGQVDLANLMKQRSLSGDIAGMEVQERFYEAGSPEGLKDLTEYFSKGAA